tara:strand:- start:37 stop:438 length:402 start_codon:yes stop_codon:yes gene_type:complete
MTEAKHRIHIYLNDYQLDKLENELVNLGKKPEKKKSELIRFMIDSYNSDKKYFSPDQLQMLQNEFENLVRLGGNFNQLLYHLNSEELELMQGKQANYTLDVDSLIKDTKEIYDEVLDLKEIVRLLAQTNRTNL